LLQIGTIGPRLDAGGQARTLFLARLPPHLHEQPRAFVETQVSRGVPNRQKAAALGADVDVDGIEPRRPAHDPAEMNAAGGRGVAALDIELHRCAAFDAGGEPLARPGGDQQASGHTRYPRPASNCAVS